MIVNVNGKQVEMDAFELLEFFQSSCPVEQGLNKICDMGCKDCYFHALEDSQATMRELLKGIEELKAKSEE